MRYQHAAIAAVILLSSAAPAFAISCREEISTIERRLNSAGAGKAEGKQTSTETTSSNSPKALDKQPEGDPSDPSTKPTASGVSDAKGMIEKARSQEKVGDEKGCQETMTKVKETAGALP